MTKEEEEVLEVQILRKKLTDAEDQLILAAKAVSETEMKIRIVMKRLLTANDVNADKPGHRQMRENILEQMNDLRRNILGFFASAGIVPHASDNHRTET